MKTSSRLAWPLLSLPPALAAALAAAVAAALAGGGCRLVGDVECESSLDCPSSVPICRDGLCRPGAPDADAGALDGGTLDGGADVDGGGDQDAGDVDAGADGGVDAGAIDATPIAPPGGAIEREDALDAANAAMQNAPFETCEQADAVPRGTFRYDAHAFVNETGSPQLLEIIAIWGGGEDGQLLLYRPSFDPLSPETNCAVGDDDDGASSSSRLSAVAIAPGEVVTVVSTTRFEDRIIPNYLLSVATLGDPPGDDAGVVDGGADAGPGGDDAGAADAGLDDAGAADAGPQDARGDAGFDAGIEGPSVLITEVSDHPLDFTLRYVELANVGNAAQDLTGWRLRLYANGQSLPSAALPLAGAIGPGQTFVVARNSAEFQATFGFVPQMASDTVVNGSGNDVYELTDGVSVIDIYGERGVDGTNQPWDYTDRIVKRDLDVFVGNPVWQASEWTKSASASAASPGSRD